MKTVYIDMSAQMDLVTVFHFIGAALDIVHRTTINLNPRYQLFYLLISTSVIPTNIPGKLKIQTNEKGNEYPVL